MVIIVSIDMGRVGMGRVGIVLDLVAEFVMGRLCQGPSLLWAEFVMGRDVPESILIAGNVREDMVGMCRVVVVRALFLL